MTPRTLWTIILKIFGLYIFLQVLYVLPQVFTTIVFFKENNGVEFQLALIALLLFTLSIFLFMLIGFIFRTDWLISKLRLDRGFSEEKLELNMHRSTVLRIAIIITGLISLIESLPILLKDLFTYYREINEFNGFKQYPNAGWIIFHFVKVLISYFMISSSRLIVNFSERKRKGKILTEDTQS